MNPEDDSLHLLQHAFPKCGGRPKITPADSLKLPTSLYWQVLAGWRKVVMYQIIQDEAAMAVYVQHAETLHKRRLHYWCVCSDRQPDLKQQAFFAVDLDKEPTTLRRTR